MDKKYSPESIETTCYQHWESHHYFAPQGDGKPVCIMLPPPNVTGSLHMGHGFQHTLMDAFVRYNRMCQKRTLWQGGTDHAGISTQLVVEQRLLKEGKLRKNMTREEFLSHVWSWKETSGNNISKQMRRLGNSIDWERERFTMDEGLSAAVQKVFVQLYDEGLIYRGTRLVNWDPHLRTAVSDLEVISSEEHGWLWHIRYPIADSDQSIVIATTRPETMLGDTAVAVHPEDKRYQSLIGQQIQLPLCNRTIPIIADDAVDPEFGTGCVKITPAHDFNDYQIGKRHELPMVNILTKNATVNKNAPIDYQGMDRFVAREKIIKDLETLSLLVKTEPHTLKVPRGEKSNTVIEPLLTDQWYVNVQPLAKPAIEAVENGQIRFVPENWSKTYFQWMNNIEDWCISRQLWWGHRIPAWYDNQGHVYVGYSENDIRFKYKLDENIQLKQDEDVLDTWFSSALWPFSSLGWPKRSNDLKAFYPTTTLFTGFDIIFFWVARMIMMGLHFTGKAPFKEVVITGLICDYDGKKMSKSKGNVLDPIDIIDGVKLPELLEKRCANLLLESAKSKVAKATKKQFPDGIEAYGADALRFAFCSLASQTRVVRFDISRVEACRNFCNKLWNAARYVLINVDTKGSDMDDGAFQYSPADRWILSRLQTLIKQCHQHFESYRFDLLAQNLYDFVWHEYCDWYLELSKTVLYDEQALSSMKRGTRRTLALVLTQIIKLLHPIIPFITETIWQQVSKLTISSDETIMLANYPEIQTQFIDKTTEEEVEWLKQVIQAVRTIRSEMSIAPSKHIPLNLRHATVDIQNRVKIYSHTLHSLCKLTHIHFLETTEASPPSASAVLDELEILIPMEGLINKDSELQRLEKEIEKLHQDIARAQRKLENPAFIDKAPQDIVSNEQEKLARAQTAHDKLSKHLATIQALPS